jgi:hypothetical protein
VIDLGDPIVLTFNVTDTSGNPADATAAVLTITLPDASVVTPAVVHGGLGTYSATYPTTQAGRHAVRGVATGTNASAYTDAFNVSAADPGMIIGLADARTALGWPAALVSASKDSLLRSYIATATPIMEDIVGPILARAHTEEYDGGATSIQLLWAPVISITSVKESYGNFTRTLTAQPLDGGPFDAYGYTVDLVSGTLTRRYTGQVGTFVGGRRNVLVAYVAGRTVIGENVIKATQRLLRWLYAPEQGEIRPDVSDTNAMSKTPSGLTIPKDVITLCGADVRITTGVG